MCVLCTESRCHLYFYSHSVLSIQCLWHFLQFLSTNQISKWGKPDRYVCVYQIQSQLPYLYIKNLLSFRKFRVSKRKKKMFGLQWNPLIKTHPNVNQHCYFSQYRFRGNNPGIQGLIAWLSTHKHILTFLYSWLEKEIKRLMCLWVSSAPKAMMHLHLWCKGPVPFSTVRIWFCHWIQLPKYQYILWKS